ELAHVWLEQLPGNVDRGEMAAVALVQAWGFDTTDGMEELTSPEHHRLLVQRIAAATRIAPETLWNFAHPSGTAPLPPWHVPFCNHAVAARQAAAAAPSAWRLARAVARCVHWTLVARLFGAKTPDEERRLVANQLARDPAWFGWHPPDPREIRSRVQRILKAWREAATVRPKGTWLNRHHYGPGAPIMELSLHQLDEWMRRRVRALGRGHTRRPKERRRVGAAPRRLVIPPTRIRRSPDKSKVEA